MMSKITLPQGVTLFHADCRDALRSLPDNSVDAVPCDPPYELTQANRRVPPPVGAGPYGRHRVGVSGDNKPVGGFMGKEWDGTGIAHDAEFWAEVYRVLKPGGHLAAFSASRTYHRMACAIEDAGFEIRDSLMWIYGTGFPKSLDVSKAIDKAAGVEFEAVPASGVGFMGPDGPGGYNVTKNQLVRIGETSDAARQWEGFGTALKPAFEPIVLARKPLSEPTVAANVLRWRTGALNIDGCRVATDETITSTCNIALGSSSGGVYSAATVPGVYVQKDGGRWPANVVTDGSDEVVGMFPTAGGQQGRAKQGGDKAGSIYGKFASNVTTNPESRNNSGSAARFFYSAKASKADRNGSKHPTVKPIALMQWLARLITPPGGTILDPFAGSGTTGAAAVAEGFAAILCEREAEYVADIRRRLGGARPPIPLDALRAELALVPQVAALRSRLAAARA